MQAAGSQLADAVDPGQRLPSLTSLRWFAASMVFLSHARELLVFDVAWFDRISVQGSSGVSFFFILSGFVLMWSYRPSTNRSTFYVRRFARVYPAYFLVAVVSAPIIWLLGEIDEVKHVVLAFLPVSLLQAWGPHYRITYAGNGVSWSLSCEAFFYLMFPLIVGQISRAKPHVRLIILGGCLATPFALAAILRPAESQDLQYLLLYTNPLARIPEFIAGIVLGALLRSGFRVPWLRVGPTSALAVAVYIAAGWAPLSIRTIPLTVIPFALLIFAAAQADVQGSTPRILRSQPLIKLGQWSYCFYLVHQMVLRVFAAGDGRTTSTGFALSAAAYLVSIGLSGALYQWVEHPMERRLRSWWEERERIRAPATAAGLK